MVSELTPATYAAMGATVMLAACFQGAAGIGFSIIGAPVCALLFPQLVPGPLLLLGLPLSILSWHREAASTDWSLGMAAIAGRFAGTIVAAQCLLVLSAQVLGLLFAMCILAAVVLSASGWKVSASRTNLAVAGLAAGVMGTVTSAGGPPLAIAMQNVQPDRLRATLGCVFTVGSVFSLAALYLIGQFDIGNMLLGLALLPCLLAGFSISTRLMRHLSQAGMRRALLGLATLSALSVIVDALSKS
ncbi:MAG: hypothetical protein RLZ83_1652 [Pseudomonadota bacterium]